MRGSAISRSSIYRTIELRFSITLMMSDSCSSQKCFLAVEAPMCGEKGRYRSSTGQVSECQQQASATAKLLRVSTPPKQARACSTRSLIGRSCCLVCLGATSLRMAKAYTFFGMGGHPLMTGSRGPSKNSNHHLKRLFND
jgi:hypothetical protein